MFNAEIDLSLEFLSQILVPSPVQECTTGAGRGIELLILHPQNIAAVREQSLPGPHALRARHAGSGPHLLLSADDDRRAGKAYAQT